jgi:hypothetical protein
MDFEWKELKYLQENEPLENKMKSQKWGPKYEKM